MTLPGALAPDSAHGKRPSRFWREEIHAALQAKKKALADVNKQLCPPRLCC
jgi:hypothetical protein